MSSDESTLKATFPPAVANPLEDGEVSSASRQAGHEVSDAHPAPLAKVAIAIAALVLIAFVGMLVLFRTLTVVQPVYDGGPEPHPLVGTRPSLEGPRIQVDPPRQRRELDAAEARQLTSYEWIEPEARVARIPVQRAIELLAERGLPETAGADAGVPPSRSPAPAAGGS